MGKRSERQTGRSIIVAWASGALSALRGDVTAEDAQNALRAALATPEEKK